MRGVLGMKLVWLVVLIMLMACSICDGKEMIIGKYSVEEPTNITDDSREVVAWFLSSRLEMKISALELVYQRVKCDSEQQIVLAFVEYKKDEKTICSEVVLKKINENLYHVLWFGGRGMFLEKYGDYGVDFKQMMELYK
jgi:hypothetical protein